MTFSVEHIRKNFRQDGTIEIKLRATNIEGSDFDFIVEALEQIPEVEIEKISFVRDGSV